MAVHCIVESTNEYPDEMIKRWYRGLLNDLDYEEADVDANMKGGKERKKDKERETERSGNGF